VYVDNLSDPTAITVFRSDSISAPRDFVVTGHFAAARVEMTEWLIAVGGMPRGIARQLEVQLREKLQAAGMRA
jgi:hypothetical protein